MVGLGCGSRFRGGLLLTEHAHGLRLPDEKNQQECGATNDRAKREALGEGHVGRSGENQRGQRVSGGQTEAGITLPVYVNGAAESNLCTSKQRLQRELGRNSVMYVSQYGTICQVSLSAAATSTPEV